MKKKKCNTFADLLREKHIDLSVAATELTEKQKETYDAWKEYRKGSASRRKTDQKFNMVGFVHLDTGQVCHPFEADFDDNSRNFRCPSRISAPLYDPIADYS